MDILVIVNDCFLYVIRRNLFLVKNIEIIFDVVIGICIMVKFLRIEIFNSFFNNYFCFKIVEN